LGADHVIVANTLALQLLSALCSDDPWPSGSDGLFAISAVCLQVK